MVLEILCVEPINPQYSGVLETCMTLRFWFFEVLGSEIVKSVLRQGLSRPQFCGDLKKIVGSNNFSAQFTKIIFQYKNIGYNINVLQQTA